MGFRFAGVEILSQRVNQGSILDLLDLDPGSPFDLLRSRLSCSINDNFLPDCVGD
jgi:hypothetical protein